MRPLHNILIEQDEFVYPSAIMSPILLPSYHEKRSVRPTAIELKPPEMLSPISKHYALAQRLQTPATRLNEAPIQTIIPS